jgi:hypothetical protein
MEHEIRLRLNTYSKEMNHHEWYISKKPSLVYISSFMELIWATYSGGSSPWGRIVPMIEVSAREMSRVIVSLREQKKSQTN